MIAYPADAGDATIKTEVPRFRVEFWERPAPGFGWNLDAWEIDGCDSVHDVLTWVNANANGRLYTLYAVLTLDQADYLTYVLLDGVDPNAPSSSVDSR